MSKILENKIISSNYNEDLILADHIAVQLYTFKKIDLKITKILYLLG